MKNALAVYSSKSAVKGKKLVELAEAEGLQIRFLALGGYLPGEPEAILKKSLTSTQGGGHLIVGAWEDDAKSLAEYDKHIAKNDRLAISNMLNGGELPFCELYSAKFDYEKTIKQLPKSKAGIDGSVSKQELPTLKSAKTRQIIYNQSRSKTGGKLMRQLTEILSQATGGIVADYKQPPR